MLACKSFFSASLVIAFAAIDVNIPGDFNHLTREKRTFCLVTSRFETIPKGLSFVLVFPLPYHFHYPLSTQTQGGVEPSLPFLCLSTSEEVEHLPLLAIPLTPAKLAIGLRLRDGSLIVACRNDSTGTSAKGQAQDLPCLTI